MTDTFYKDPDAVLDYKWDWSAWLAEGESIVSAVIETSTGLVCDSFSNTATAVTAFLSGGAAGLGYSATCRITTNSTPARVEDRTIYIVCRKR